MTTNNQEYPDFQGMGEDFTPAYITPHVGEYTPVTPESQKRVREVQEAVQLIYKLTEGLSMQTRRQIKSSVELILKR